MDKNTDKGPEGMAKWIDLLATVGGVGHWPKAPGTWGTMFAFPLVLMTSHLNLTLAACVTFLFILFSIVVCHMYDKTHEHDASEVVLDEVAGYMVAALGLYGWWYLVAFVLFRIFDILKPPPISLIDRKVSGGFGVVLDDVAAGMITNALIHFVLIGEFGEQINSFFR